MGEDLRFELTDDQGGVLICKFKYLRKLLSQECESYVEAVNEGLKNVSLSVNERLEERLRTESRRKASEFKRVKGGNNQQKFDKKEMRLQIHDDEINEARTSIQTDCESTPQLNNRSRIDNSSKSHRHRLMKQLRCSSSKALSFSDGLGVLPKKLIFETLDGTECRVSIDGTQSNRVSFVNLDERTKKEVKDMVNICDRTRVSDAAYHEFAMKFPEMPRKYQLTDCRNNMNQDYIVKRTPGLLQGSYLSIKSELLKYLERCATEGSLPKSMQVKISGDGTRVSRVSNFVVISYTIIDKQAEQSHLNQRVIAIVNCEEKYDNLKTALGPVFGEINSLVDDGFVGVGEERVDLEFYVGGDMKFIQLILGLNGSLATYSCPWCIVSKDERGNITYPYDHYHTKELFRTVNQLNDLVSTSSKQKYGVVHRLLLDIEPNHYIPDELHLLLRITDVLLRNIINDAKSKDDFAKIIGGHTDNLSMLVQAIQSCGVTFRTWQTKSGELEWTSLTGNDKKRILHLLPAKMLFSLHEDTAEEVIQLWNDFEDIYNVITDTNKRQYDPLEIHSQVRAFMQRFFKIGYMKREGYGPSNVTPYLHVLLYHVPLFLSNLGSLSLYSGQAVEKTNDIIKSIHQSKSNKHDPTTDALLTRKRQEAAYSCGEQRTKRHYRKKDTHYWSSEISNIRQRKANEIQREQVSSDEAYKQHSGLSLYENLSDVELKDILNKLEVKTRIRKREKLLQLVRKHK